MGLIAVFFLALMFLWLAFYTLADWLRPSTASDRWYVREGKSFLTFWAAFLITWIVYQALARRFFPE